jgi:hypothetical protein
MKKRISVLISICILLIPGLIAAEGIENWTNHFDGKLTIGAELRLRGEARQDYDFNSSASSLTSDDRFGLSRIRLNLDVKPVPHLRLFTEIQDSRDYRAAITRRIGAGAFEDRVDFFQLFVDIKDLNSIPLTVRLGRQALAFGDQRLVGSFGWSNVGRSFQGIRLIMKEDPVEVNLWWANVVNPEDGELNEPIWNDDFIGFLATWQNIAQGNLDTYLLLRDNNSSGRQIFTLGGHFSGEPTVDGSIDYDIELAYQTGDFLTEVDHSAILFHAGMGRTLMLSRMKPRFGFQYNFASGDPIPSDSENKTPDNFYPTNHLHYGSIDFFSWRNMQNVKLESSLKPHQKLLVKGDLNLFWLSEVQDAWYSAGGASIRPADGNREADTAVGKEIDITAKYTYNKHFNIMTGYSHFFTGSFVEATGFSDNPNWFFLQTTFSL